MSSNHTEGKWFIGDTRNTSIDRDGLKVNAKIDGEKIPTHVCRIFNPSGFALYGREEAIKEVESNAALIAAAPEMLEILTTISEYTNVTDEMPPRMKESLLEIIKKATA